MVTHRPHVVLVAWGFPPFRGSGAFRPLAMANGLVRAGARVTVVTTSREVFLVNYGADPALEDLVDPAIEFVRVPFYPEKTWPLLNDWSMRRADQPTSYSAHDDPALEMFPEPVYAPWLSRVHGALLHLQSQRSIDLIVATGSPYVDLQAAVLMHSDFGVPVVLDDRDSFVLNVFTGGHHDYYDKRLQWFLNWLDQCREMWFVNPPIAQRHRAEFPAGADRIKVVENGWDPGVVRPEQIAAVPQGPLRTGYVGLVPSNFPLADVLSAWAGATAGADDTAALLFIGPLGYEVGSQAWTKAQRAIEGADHVEWYGHVPRNDLSAVYNTLDVLLFVKEGGSMVTGGKVYEYAATGLPIVALIDEAGDAARVLAGYPRLHTADHSDPAAAAAAIRSAFQDRRTGDEALLHAAQEFGARLSRERHLQPHLDRIVGEVSA
jgi:glycosyltransferase involved in cell wall biosynthesis